MGLATGLVARLREIQAMAGMGVPASPSAELTAMHGALTDVSVAATNAWKGTQWVGEAADAASEFTRSAVAAVTAVADRAEGLRAVAGRATDAVARARSRLQAIVEEFEARAAALEPRLDDPGVAEELIEEGHRALAEANAVLDDLRAELDAQADAVSPPTTSPSAALPALPGWGMPDSGTPATSSPGMTSALGSGFDQGMRDAAAPRVSDPAEFGNGVAVQLPDGSTATAPNDVAASAVRHALTQLGVPYGWGGEAPGVEMDCSGLTQWSYHEAGLDLPRLAQEQDIGTAVDRGSLRPGDLAVWDGHVAMIVGNGQMIEAGDPVHLSPIRTTNSGQGFQGFWRPTA